MTKRKPKRECLELIKKSRLYSAMYVKGLTNLGRLLSLQKKWTDAESVFREGLANSTNDEWTVIKANSLLGRALLEQKKYADAEPPLLKSQSVLARPGFFDTVEIYELMNCRAENLARLIRLYTEQGKKEEAAKWQKELDAVLK